MRAIFSLVRLGQAHAGLAFVLASTLALSACGVARSHASQGERSSKSTYSSRTSISTETAQCQEAEEPAPKGPQHIRKPTQTLDSAKSYIVQLETNCGDIDIKLATGRAPSIAASFAYLVKLGFYDDLTFHLVLTGYLIQGGDPEGDGSGGPGYEVIEKPPADLHYTPGTVAMAKAATDPAGAAGSQFFIVVGRKAELPPQYALLGKVVKGWSTVQAISRVPTEDDADGDDNSPSSPIVISRAILSTSG